MTRRPSRLGIAQTERIEAQHADAVVGELLADAGRRGGVLAEREPVGEDAPAAGLPGGPVDDARQPRSRRTGKTDALGHAGGLPPRFALPPPFRPALIHV